MYLKKIEIQGFKSFADKIEIEFKDDITAIVGPNGSGKSNISDAIRWVLGEQSIKNLRGNKMEDVIFSGTDKRRALGFAEVSIIFDNMDKLIPLDYNEIMITRRVFRSGESEYYINKNSCRLKDIRELFMDTGIGKDGYSIIGQGRIEEILSNRPEDRRNIFEEAAEIVKYKWKKEAAEKKLDKTEANLIRIKDLIYEIKKQAEVLEDESNKAISFTSIYNKLREIEVNIFIKEIKKLNIQIHNINKDMNEINIEILESEAEKNSIEEKFNLLKNNIEDMDNKIEIARNSKGSIIQDLDNYKNNIAIHVEKVNFYKKDLERLTKEKKDLNLSLNNMKDIEQDIISEISAVESNLESLNQKYKIKEIERIKIDDEIKVKEGYIENIKARHLNNYNRTSDVRNKLDNMDSYNDNIIKRIEDLKREKHNIENSLKNNIDDLEKCKQNEIGLKDNINSFSNSFNKLLIEKEEISQKQDQVYKTIKEMEIKLQGLISNQTLYKSMEAGYEGYFKSVKNLLLALNKSNDMKEGFLGIVADLIKVDEKFERAIDISLGSSVQNLVMEKDIDAKRLIDYLKKNKLGRVTFLPLNTIKGNLITLNPEDMDKYNVMGLGNQLIKYDNKYENIFKYLLGRTIIIKDMDSALGYASKYGHSNRIVTLDGDLLSPGGSMTGGSYGNNTLSIINRKNRIKSLDKNIVDLQSSLDALKTKGQVYKSQLEQLEKNIDISEKNKKDLELELIQIMNNINGYKNEISRSEKELARSVDGISALETEKGGLSHNKEELEVELEELEKENNLRKEEIDKLTEDLKQSRILKESNNNDVTDYKIKINLMENTFRNLNEKLLQQRKEMELNKNLILEKNNMILDIENELSSINRDILVIEKDIEKLKIDEIEASEYFDGLSEDKNNFMKTFYQEQERLKNITNKLSILEKQNSKQEIKLAKNELQVENNHIKLLEEYELTYEGAKAYEIEIPNMQKALEEVKGLKAEIKELGSVNIGSIEDFIKVKERLDFITSQQDDLIFSRESLKEIIKDIEKKMRVQFIHSFNQINENFNEIFAVLFSGGTAKLVLEEGEDVLHSGIDIVVQPPGKKLQTLSLLSGGEKSLTAVALLFAILKTKPAPFCILDEIDAALDEANINRYTNYLKHFNEDTQFILITHRKTTMEIANVLYGVTMAEEGISKLISVKLKDNLEVEAS